MRQALGLGNHPVTIGEPFQILAEVEEPVRRALGVDTVGVWIPDEHVRLPQRRLEALDAAGRDARHD